MSVFAHVALAASGFIVPTLLFHVGIGVHEWWTAKRAGRAADYSILGSPRSKR